MSRFTKASLMPASPAELFAWHARPGAFERLVPPWERIEMPGGHPGVVDGARVTLRLRQGPLALTWVAEHRDVEPGRGFVDEQVKGPFARWIHHHRFSPADAKSGAGGPAASARSGSDPTSPRLPDGPTSELEDSIDFALPFGLLGERLGEGRVRAQLERTFAFRHRRTRQDLERHAPFAGKLPLRVVVTGASGLVGSALVPFLTTGRHRVTPLVRRPAPSGSGAVFWDPRRGVLDPADLAETDAVVHLAGANIAEGRWTAARKKEIRDSRVESTALLARTLAGMDRPPRVMVVASGTGYYGPGSDARDETTLPGTGFLPEVAQAVEAATRPAQDAGIRVVVLRIGIVLSLRGGLLGRLARVFRLGAGAVLGSGDQPLSWITRDDLVGIIHHALFDPTLEGPINAVAPEPATQGEFARALGRTLNRPVLFRVPGFLLRKALGEMAEAAVLEGAEVRPARLAGHGFLHLHPELESALRWELGCF